MKSINRRQALIITGIILISSLIIILILNTKIIIAYGIIKQSGGGFIMDAEIINCEVTNNDIVLVNGLMVNSLVNETIGLQGISLFDYLIIQSINETYNPGPACFEYHSSDINIMPLNYTIKANNSTLIEYNVTNFQDQRLFYECRLTTNCSVIRSFFTGYLDPTETHLVHFNITCDEGIHESMIKTVFVDELANYHYANDTLIITAE